MTNSTYQTVTSTHDHSMLEVSNGSATAQVSLFGAQVLSYIPHKDKRERLYLSAKAHLDGSSSIRGGVPVCWPWFGAHKTDSTLPAHGYVRKQTWTLSSVIETQKTTSLLLEAQKSLDLGFTGTARLQLKITIGDELKIELITSNVGLEPFDFSCALHSYFLVTDINQTKLVGLKGEYSDKTQNWQRFSTPECYRITAETDRIHLEPASLVSIETGSEITTIKSTGHDSIVVWNPWSACKQNFPDMEAKDYTRMLCVESALTQGYVLEAGERHMLSQTIG